VDADLLSWDDIAAACAVLASEIRGENIPDVVVGISRGGLVPAVLVTHLLGVRDLRALTVSKDGHRPGQCRQARRPDPRQPGRARRPKSGTVEKQGKPLVMVMMQILADCFIYRWLFVIIGDTPPYDQTVTNPSRPGLKWLSYDHPRSARRIARRTC
jgi:hypothetical protein